MKKTIALAVAALILYAAGCLTAEVNTGHARGGSQDVGHLSSNRATVTAPVSLTPK